MSSFWENMLIQCKAELKEEQRREKELHRQTNGSQVYWAKGSKHSTIRELLFELTFELLFDKSRATRIAEACKVKDDEVNAKFLSSFANVR